MLKFIKCSKKEEESDCVSMKLALENIKFMT